MTRVKPVTRVQPGIGYFIVWTGFGLALGTSSYKSLVVLAKENEVQNPVMLDG